MRKWLIIGFLFTMSAFLSIVPAQEDEGVAVVYDDVTILTNMDPTPDDIFNLSTETTLEELTTVSDEYYGRVVTVEGEIGEFVNARAFALGESATLDNDLILVVNNSNQTFPPEIMAEARVRVTGRVQPSRIAVTQGAQTDFGALFTLEDDTVESENEGMADTSSNGQERHDMVEFAQNGYFAAGFDNYTILEILNIETVVFYGFNQDDIGN